MTLRSLIAKMDAIEQGINEAFNIKTLQQQVGGLSDANQRHTAVAQLAKQNSVPGLYDPVDGSYISATGSVSSTAPHEVDSVLASKGLLPKNANTSTMLGKMFGTSGDAYDKELRGQSDKVVADQTSAEFKATKFKELQDIMAKLSALKKVDTTPAQASAPAAPQAQPAGQAATPAIKPQSVTQNSNGTFTLTKKDGTKFNISADGKVVKEMKEIDIASSLIESFGYQIDEAPATVAATAPSATKQVATTAATAAGGYAAGKVASKVLGRAIPGVGAALSAKDAYDRWQAGDRTGAVISTLAGIGWLVPGPAGWMVGGALDAANIGRDLAGGSKPEQAATPAAPQGASDPKVLALQKYLKNQGADLGATGPNGDGVDGVMGPKTRAAMDKAQLSESQRMAILMLQLETLNEAIPGAQFAANALKGIMGKPAVGKEVTTAAGDTYRWLGAAWAKVNPATGKASQMATKDVAKELNSMSHGVKAIPGAVKGAVQRNPVKAGAAAVATGLGTGYMAGGPDDSEADSASSAGGGAGNKAPADQAATPEQVCSPEQMQLIDQARKAMSELSDLADADPAMAQVLSTYQTQIDNLKCDSSTSGQGATPAGGSPLTQFYNNVGTQ